MGCWSTVRVTLLKLSTIVAQHPQTMYIKRVKARHTMRLQTSATQVDYYPVTPAGKRFVRRVIWHPGAETEMKSFSTIVKTDMLYDANNHIANGAEVIDFNIHCYAGNDYTPMGC